jgi:hypothetical protein
MTSGSTAYLTLPSDRDTWRGNPKGTIACRRSRWSVEDTYHSDLQDPRDMVKAELPESQFPVMQPYIPCSQCLYRRATKIRRFLRYRQNPPLSRRWRMTPFKETNGTPTSCYFV